jgi:hypothetical protein
MLAVSSTGHPRARWARARDALQWLEATSILTITRRIERRKVARVSPITGMPEIIITTVQASSPPSTASRASFPAQCPLDGLPYAPSRNGRKAATTSGAIGALTL